MRRYRFNYYYTTNSTLARLLRLCRAPVGLHSLQKANKGHTEEAHAVLDLKNKTVPTYVCRNYSNKPSLAPDQSGAKVSPGKQAQHSPCSYISPQTQVGSGPEGVTADSGKGSAQHEIYLDPDRTQAGPQSQTTHLNQLQDKEANLTLTGILIGREHGGLRSICNSKTSTR